MVESGLRGSTFSIYLCEEEEEVPIRAPTAAGPLPSFTAQLCRLAASFKVLLSAHQDNYMLPFPLPPGVDLSGSEMLQRYRNQGSARPDCCVIVCPRVCYVCVCRTVFLLDGLGVGRGGGGWRCRGVGGWGLVAGGRGVG